MPFIAIAVFVALAVGGVSTVAERAQPGDALYQYKMQVNDNAREAYHSVKASLNLEADAEANADANTDISAAGGTPEDSNFEESTNDSHVDSNINVDGSIKVNVF